MQHAAGVGVLDGVGDPGQEFDTIVLCDFLPLHVAIDPGPFHVLHGEVGNLLAADARLDLRDSRFMDLGNSRMLQSSQELHLVREAAAVIRGAVKRGKEFQGNVAFVGTKDFFRPKEQSPSGQAYHWNSNAETYYLIGDGMGKAMLHLLKN